MSMIRTIRRNVAKNLMKDMGYENVGQKMHLRIGDKDTLPSKEAVVKLQKTAQGRAKLAKAMEKHPPLWKEVLGGSKKKDADKAFEKMSWRREQRLHPDREKPKKFQKRVHYIPNPVS